MPEEEVINLPDSARIKVAQMLHDLDLYINACFDMVKDGRDMAQWTFDPQLCCWRKRPDIKTGG